MRFWFNTEFIEDGKTIDLISIGIVREDGLCYYAESAECDLSRASDWVKQNVIPHLDGTKTSRKTIAQEIVAFMGDVPEIWGYYCDYDWVILCQLFGTMMNLPKNWPMFCLDLKQWAWMLGNPKLPKATPSCPKHHALADAIWNKQVWEFLKKFSEEFYKMPE